MGRRIKSVLFRILASTIIASVLAYCELKYFLVELPRRRAPKVHAGQGEQATGLWCVCAIYQPRRLSGNLLAYLTGMAQAGYNVVAVHNGTMAQAVIDELNRVCHLVLVRSAGGRDFGSYKAGTAYIHQHVQAEKLRQVVYSNDSIFIRPTALRTLLGEVRELNDDYIGVMETFEHHYHVHSWFFAVSQRLFTSAAYQKFWTNYRPLSNRIHAIRRGEIRLAVAMVKNGIYPSVLYTTRRLTDSLLPAERAPDLARLIGLTNLPTYRHVVEIMRSTYMLPPDTLRPLLARLISDLASVENAANMFNLLALQSVDFPFLKKDLVYKGGYICAQVDQAMENWHDEDALQLAEIKGYFRARDAMHWQNFFHQLLARTGVI